MKRWWTHKTLSYFKKRYWSLDFFRSCRVKETVYETCVNRIRSTKKKMSMPREEMDSRHRPWIFSLVFGYSSNVQFPVLILPSAYRVWAPFSELIPKWRQKPLTVFTSPYLIFTLLFLSQRARRPTNLQTQVVLLLPPRVGRRNISVFCLSTVTQKIWALCLFSSHS